MTLVPGTTMIRGCVDSMSAYYTMKVAIFNAC